MITLNKIRLWWLRWKLDRTKLDPDYELSTAVDSWKRSLLVWQLGLNGIIEVKDERPA